MTSMMSNVQSEEANFVNSTLQALGSISVDQFKFLYKNTKKGAKNVDIKPCLSFMVKNRQIRFYGAKSDVILPYFTPNADMKQILCNWVAIDMLCGDDKRIDVTAFLENVTTGDSPVVLSFVKDDILFNLIPVDSSSLSKLLLVQERYVSKLAKVKPENQERFIDHYCNVFVTNDPNIKQEVAKIGVTMPHKIAIVNKKHKSGELPEIKYYTKK
ncbi:MAG: hypothetical protein K2K56_10550 [Lachnospiraceae bacterium]|nr:hypothetical protein [Lachnospiraceae bacterium]